jgi:3-methyladenine DNA glycosylase AlkC
VEEAKDDVEEIVTEFVEEAVDEVKDKIFESLTKKDIEENEVVTEMPENMEDDMITETAESVVEESVSEGLNNVTEFIKEDDDKFEMPEVNNNLDDIYGSVRTKDCNSCTEEKIFYNTNDSIIPDNCDKCKYKYIN